MYLLLPLDPLATVIVTVFALKLFNLSRRLSCSFQYSTSMLAPRSPRIPGDVAPVGDKNSGVEVQVTSALLYSRLPVKKDNVNADELIVFRGQVTPVAQFHHERLYP